MTRTLTGTPRAVLAPRAYEYTATDSDPSEPDVASLTFTIEVAVSEARRAVLNDALAAQGRALLTGATDAIGERFRASPAAAPRAGERADAALDAIAGFLGGAGGTYDRRETSFTPTGGSWAAAGGPDAPLAQWTWLLWRTAVLRRRAQRRARTPWARQRARRKRRAESPLGIHARRPILRDVVGRGKRRRRRRSARPLDPLGRRVGAALRRPVRCRRLRRRRDLALSGRGCPRRQLARRRRPRHEPRRSGLHDRGRTRPAGDGVDGGASLRTRRNRVRHGVLGRRRRRRRRGGTPP